MAFASPCRLGPQRKSPRSASKVVPELGPFAVPEVSTLAPTPVSGSERRPHVARAKSESPPRRELGAGRRGALVRTSVAIRRGSSFSIRLVAALKGLGCVYFNGKGIREWSRTAR